MPDVVSEVTYESPGTRIANSIGGMIFGAFLFLASFAVLWWNEGNVIAEKNALDEMRRSLVKADAAAPKTAHEGKLIHASSKLLSKTKLGDAPYLKPGPYLKLERQVEMYQWVEDEKTEKNGGTKKTTYTYQKKWAAGRERSESFHSTDGHVNPPLKEQAAALRVDSASFGKLDGMAVVERLDADHPLKLTGSMLAKSGSRAPKLVDNRLYLASNKGDAPNPRVGDVRISYRAVKPGVYSVIARQTGKSLSAYHAQNGKENFLVEAGAKPPAAMIETAKETAGFIAMILRFVGFVMMWFGLNLLAAPITTVLSFIPFLGAASRFVLAAAFFAVAAALSTITIILAMVAHNPILLGVALLVFAAGGYMLWQRRRGTRQAGAPQGLATGARPEADFTSFPRKAA